MGSAMENLLEQFPDLVTRYRCAEKLGFKLAAKLKAANPILADLLQGSSGLWESRRSLAVTEKAVCGSRCRVGRENDSNVIFCYANVMAKMEWIYLSIYTIIHIYFVKDWNSNEFSSRQRDRVVSWCERADIRLIRLYNQSCTKTRLIRYHEEVFI